MDDLTDLLHDAVDDIEPDYRLDAIRERVRRPRRRYAWHAVGGASVAVAATVVVLTVIASRPVPGTERPPVADPPSTTAVDPTPADPTTEQPVTDPPRPVYYVGDTPAGSRLFRYFEPNDSGEPDHGTGTVIGLLMSAPTDPDYRTLWPTGSLAGLEIADDVAIVSVRDSSVHDRPRGMSADEAELAIQQVVYTVQAAVQERLPVQFILNGNPIDQVFGVPTSEALSAAPPLEVLSHVNLSDPVEGLVVPPGTQLAVSGVANSFEANVAYRLQRYEGTQIVAQGAFTATGYTEPRLFPFDGTIDLTGVEPGAYLLIVSTDDPSGEGRFDTDTRTVLVQ